MECSKAEGLLTDHVEAVLAEPLAGEVQAHLASCSACGELARGLTEVLEALEQLRNELPVVPAGLAARVAARSFRPLRARQPVLGRGAFGAWQAAAVLAAALGVFMGSGLTSPATARRVAAQVIDRGADTEAYLIEQRDRMLGEVRVLNLELGSAFEERLDNVSARVDDYRRLLNKRRESDKRSAFPNSAWPSCVRTSEPAGSGTGSQAKAERVPTSDAPPAGGIEA